MLEGNITLGGYRLYSIIRYIYGDDSVTEEAKETIKDAECQAAG